MSIRLVRQADLPPDAFSHDFVGEQFGGVGACVIFVEAPPGAGPKLHRPPYIELLIVLAGPATLAAGVSTREVGEGQMAIVDANQVHGFVNRGDGILRQVDIHLSPKFITEWLA